MSRACCLILSIGILVAASVSATASERWWRDAADSAAFNAQVSRLHEQMQPGERYGDVGEHDRAEIERNLALLRPLFDARGSVAAMNDDDRVVVLNAQERINALLEGNDGDRMVCTREAQMGTRFRTTTCMTVRERANLKKIGSEVVRKNQYNRDTKRDGG